MKQEPTGVVVVGEAVVVVVVSSGHTVFGILSSPQNKAFVLAEIKKITFHLLKDILQLRLFLYGALQVVLGKLHNAIPHGPTSSAGPLN